MSVLHDADRSAIARHVAVLRRRGWPVERALKLLAGRLPSGNARAWVDDSLAALARGEMPGAGTDPLIALLARGEAAPVESLDEAVRAAELAIAARQAVLAGFSGRGALAASVVLVLLLGAFVIEPGWRVLVALGPVPPATEAVLALLSAMRIIAPLLVLGLVAAWFRRDLLSRFFPGVLALETAAALRSRLAALESGLESPGDFSIQALAGLDTHERLLAAGLLADEGATAVLRMLAQEKEREGRAASARALAVLPLWQLFLIGWFVSGFVLALYLPIFSIAGAVK
jgi:hypothetical protein